MVHPVPAEIDSVPSRQVQEIELIPEEFGLPFCLVFVDLELRRLDQLTPDLDLFGLADDLVIPYAGIPRTGPRISAAAGLAMVMKPEPRLSLRQRSSGYIASSCATYSSYDMSSGFSPEGTPLIPSVLIFASGG
jgi:hypothetical protein